MRRFFRILLNAATVLSSVLCVVTLALWARSYAVQDRWIHIARSREERTVKSHLFWSLRGELSLTVTGRAYFNERAFDREHAPENRPAAGDWPSREGFSYAPRRLDPERPGSRSASPYRPWQGFTFQPSRGWVMIRGTPSRWSIGFFGVPHWFVVVLFAAVPAARLARRLRAARRVRGNLCRACGYDLRATPDRCPECGATASATKPAAQQPGAAAPR